MRRTKMCSHCLWGICMEVMEYSLSGSRGREKGRGDGVSAVWRRGKNLSTRTKETKYESCRNVWQACLEVSQHNFRIKVNFGKLTGKGEYWQSSMHALTTTITRFISESKILLNKSKFPLSSWQVCFWWAYYYPSFNAHDFEMFKLLTSFTLATAHYGYSFKTGWANSTLEYCFCTASWACLVLNSLQEIKCYSDCKLLEKVPFTYTFNN